MKKQILIISGALLLGALTVGAVKVLVIVPNTVSSYSDLFDRYILERSSIPPFPSPVPYMDVLTNLQANDGSFLNTKFWMYDHTGSTLYLAEDSSLAKQLKLPMELMIQENILRDEVVIWGAPLGTDRFEGLALFDAPEFTSFSSKDGVSVEKYLMDEFAPRRVTMHFVLKAEEDAWSDLLIAQEQAEAVAMPMMMATSSSETITDFRIVQDSTNLSVNLPPEFIGATVDLLSSTNLVEGIWSTVLQTNTMSTGTIFLSYADIPDFIYETNVTSGWVDCPSCAMDPGAVCTNQTLVVSTNQVAVGGGLVYYRTSASSLVDSDHDGLGNLIEYEIGTGYLDVDSDDDGLLDGEEVDAGQDPTTANGVPDEFDSPMQSASNGVFVVLPERCWHAQESSLNLETYGAYGE